MFYEGNDTLGYDKNNDYFSYLDSTTDSTGNTTSKSELIFKTGSHYYLTTDHPSDDTPITYEITAADAASKINGNPLKITAEKMLDLFQNSYAEFSADGTYSESNGALGHMYSATNIDLVVDASTTVTLKDIKVYIADADASLYRMGASFTNGDKSGEYNYYNYESFADRKQEYCHAPDRLEGNTFKIADITLENVPSGQEAIFNGWKTGVLNANQNKTITAKPGGTFEGDITIDMGEDGASDDLVVSTMTYTENFFQTGTYGEVKVTNGLTGTAEVTLTGNIANGFTDYNNYDDTFELSLTLQGITYKFRYAAV